ncbi:MAG: hypothetical protein KQ78_00029 [Candidatus Izimaplasma bacterium HR2]|nr:MAG: hypothetical protein KQ78_00029 [Candidatus Izimaplasma bacterium HR2]
MDDGWQFLNTYGKQYDKYEEEHFVEMVMYDSESEQQEERRNIGISIFNELTQPPEDDVDENENENYLTRTGIIR